MNVKLLPALCITIFFFCIKTEYSYAQNMLNTSTWTVSSGSSPGFARNGQVSENNREYGIGPFGNSELIWKATPDSANDGDGGWNTDYHTIDHTKTYRFTVWLKKTNSNSGHSYLGTASYNNGVHSILKLNGTTNSNPYFWVGDLPQLNKWYLVVGFVHGSNYNSNINYGGIYDPVSGNKISSITDFKFAPTAVNTRHRSYLYYDTNTSDRQYFFAPRIDKVDGNEPDIQNLLGLNDTDTNLLDTSTWTIGNGSVSGFGANGAASENYRELGKNHVGDDVVLWKAIPDENSNGDGGWNTSYHNINHTKTYRFSVWLKKTNSNDGHSYLGCNSTNNILRLNGVVNNNPYFWVGDLPKLNRWYLVVGYVHKSSYSSTVNLGRIYDGVTGEEVSSITDFKFKNTAVNIRHRSYLYYDTNTLDRQYFYAPRIDPITGNEPTIIELLQINENSKLIFSYDLAGNQTQRFYCEEDGFCSPTAPTSKDIKESIKTDEITQLAPNPDDNGLSDDIAIKNLKIYPNPTNNKVTISLSGKDYSLTRSASIYNVTGALIQKIDIASPTNQLDFDLSNKPSGVYFIHLHFTNGSITTERIIKN
jgi:hypothetical protein